MDRRGFLRRMLAAAAATALPGPAVASAAPELGTFYQVRPGDSFAGLLAVAYCCELDEHGRLSVRFYNPASAELQASIVVTGRRSFGSVDECVYQGARIRAGLEPERSAVDELQLESAIGAVRWMPLSP